MTRDETIKLTVKSLLEVVQTGAKNVEITVMDGFGKLKVRLSPQGVRGRLCADHLTHPLRLAYRT